MLCVNGPACPQATGAVLLAVGLWGRVLLGPYLSLLAASSSNAPLVLMATGTAIILVGLFGCLATCRGSVWMLRLVRASTHTQHTLHTLHTTHSTHTTHYTRYTLHPTHTTHYTHYTLYTDYALNTLQSQLTTHTHKLKWYT